MKGNSLRRPRGNEFKRSLHYYNTSTSKGARVAGRSRAILNARRHKSEAYMSSRWPPSRQVCRP